MSRRPIVVAGPSGVGKGTLIARLMQDEGTRFGFSVSYTTRAPRSGEEHGKHYYFVTREEFEKMRSAGAFYEWNEYGTNLYGTSRAEVARVQGLGMCLLFDVDINGVRQLKEAGITPAPRFVFISPPGPDPLAVLRQRLTGRGTESEASISRRLNQAAVEMQWRDKESYWDRIFINDDLDKTYQEFKAFALDVEH